MQARTSRRIASLVAGIPALGLAASTGTAGAQAADPIVYNVEPPIQLTLPGTQVGITFTISPVPPCADGNLARGFTVRPNQDYTLARTGFVLVGELPTPPPPPPSPPPEPDNGSDGAGVGAGPGSVAVVPQQAPAATAVGATARFTG
jgi:hypothetical protein